MKNQPAAARGIGTYMRNIARLLHKSTPMTTKQAYAYVHTPDMGYAAASLIRLVERGIAVEVDGSGYVQGPEWAACAAYYGWPHEDTPGATQE